MPPSGPYPLQTKVYIRLNKLLSWVFFLSKLNTLSKHSENQSQRDLSIILMRYYTYSWNSPLRYQHLGRKKSVIRNGNFFSTKMLISKVPTVMKYQIALLELKWFNPTFWYFFVNVKNLIEELLFFSFDFNTLRYIIMRLI